MRETQRRKIIQVGLGKSEKKSNRRRYKCIYPECNIDSIKSHSQQKRGQLSAIAENSMVYAMQRNMYQHFITDNKELLTKQPIGDASRYKGYCNTHDTSIFSPIENGNIDITNPEHNFLLLLRSVSYEYANKRDMYDRKKDILSHIGHLFSPERIMNYEASALGIKVFLEMDVPHYLAILFDIYESKDWSRIQYNSFEIDKNIGVSSTTCFSPFREKHSEWMSKNLDKPQPFVSFNVIPENDRTSISFVWLSEIEQFCEEFSNINFKQVNISNIINTYILCESEDICVRPTLWESLSTADRELIYRHMGTSDSLPNANMVPLVIDW